MTIHYSSETDSLMVSFREGPAVGGNSEIQDGIFLMHDQEGRVMGFEFMGNASKFVDVKNFHIVNEPTKVA
jgi:uncharacterized protein YuzE